MTTQTTTRDRMSVAEILQAFLPADAPLRVCAYDGSVFGSPDARLEIEVLSPRAVQHVVTAPGDLGLARAYLSGELRLGGVHPGAPHDLFAVLEHLRKEVARRPDARTLARVARSLGPSAVRRPPVPDLEAPPGWQRALHGLRRHTRARDLEVVSSHYDVSNRFYELVLGPSMTYTCAVYPDEGATLEQAQEHKYRLVHDKLSLARVTGSSTSAAGGAAWCAMPPVVGCARSASPSAPSRPRGRSARSSARVWAISPRRACRTTATCPSGTSTP